MRNFLLALTGMLFSLLGTAQVHQTWPANSTNLSQTLEHLVAPLDKTDVSSGFLWDKGLSGLAEPGIFDGIRRDSIYLQPMTFGLLYTQAQRSYVGTAGNPLPVPGVFMNLINRFTATDTIPLAALAWRYHRIHENALDNNLLTLQNEQLFDVPGRVQSPYWQDTLVAFTPLIADSWHKTVHFTLPTELIWQNLDWPSPLLQADFDDGNGWQILTPGHTYTVQYALGGAKTIKTRIQQGNISLESQSILFVAEGTVQGRGDGPNYPTEPEEVMSIAGGDLRIFFGSPCNKLLKPFIVVEGFELVDNPSQFQDRLKSLLQSENVITGSNLKFGEWLYAQGYDIVWVNLTNVQGYIQDNAEVVKTAIQQVNNIKAANGSNEPNLIMGVSAGGVITKFMLLKAQQTGFDHQCEKFFSYDSPLRGANIPVSIQAFLHHVNYIASTQGTDLLSSVPQIAVAFNGLNSPFARQTLLYRFFYQPGTDDWVLSSQEHDNFMAELDAMGQLSIRHIALANGSAGTSIENNITPGSLMFEAHSFAYAAGVYLNLLPPAIIPYNVGIYFDIKGYALSSNTGGVLYNGNLKVKIDDITVKQFPLYIETPENNKTYDSAPGGTSNIGLAQFQGLNGTPMPIVPIPVGFPFLPNGGITVFLPLSPLELTTYASHFCFIPTRSSLSIAESNPVTGTFSCGQSTSDRCSFSDTQTPVPAEYGLSSGTTEINQEHVFLDSRIGDIIVDEADAANLIPGGVLPSALSSYYNIGLPRQSGIPTITISSANGKLSINNTGKIAYATGNEPVSPFNSLKAYTKCEAVITVENGASLVVGADGAAKHGILTITEESTLHIKAGGALRVTSNESVLIIKPGATLILDPGALVILESPESNIRIEGSLVWNGDIHFSGLGFFDLTKTHTLELNADALRLTGSGKTNRFIRINGETTLSIPEQKGLELKTGAVEHLGYEILLGLGSWCNLNEVKMYGSAVIGLLGNNVGDVIIEACTFDGLAFPIEIAGSDNAGFLFGPLSQIKNTDFHNYYQGAHFRERIGVLFENCQFEGAANSYPQCGIFSEFNFITLVKECAISNHDAGALDASNNWADPLYTAAGTGIKVEGGWLLWMDGGEINNCEIGIANQVLDPTNGAPTNIYMNHFATIRGCHSGIVMNGDASTGLVVMDCARILDIERCGIYGEDISLVIDPLLLLQMSGGTNTVDPNVFTRGGVPGPPNKYLDICYIDKTSPEPLPAKLNYWGGNWGGTAFVDANPNWSISLKKTTPTGVPCNGTFTADVSQALQEMPIGCSRQFGPLDPDECLTEVFSGEETTVRQAFRTGIEQINNQDYESAFNLFGSIADLWQSDLSGFSNFCETFIDAAKSLSNTESRSQTISQSVSASVLFPNPASGIVTVSLPTESCQLRIWNTVGRLVLKTLASGNCRLDVSTWPAGLYWIDVSTPGTAHREYLKLVVQR